MKGHDWDIAEYPDFRRWQEALLARNSLKKVMSVSMDKEIQNPGRVREVQNVCNSKGSEHQCHMGDRLIKDRTYDEEYETGSGNSEVEEPCNKNLNYRHQRPSA